MVDPKIITHPHGDRTFTSTLYYGADVRESLKTLQAESIQCVVTSPPYWGLRDYGTGSWEGGDDACDHKSRAQTRGNIPGTIQAGNNHGEGGVSYPNVCGKCGATRVDEQIGLEQSPDDYVTSLVEVFREVRRVLRDDGVLWCNLGDSYAGGGGFSPNSPSNLAGSKQTTQRGAISGGLKPQGVIKPKDLSGIPWMVAFALRADGWYLRSDVIWSKGSCMPESVTDRPTRSHEYVFLLTKSSRYFYDAEAVREGAVQADRVRADKIGGNKGDETHHSPGSIFEGSTTRNRRSVWTINPRPYRGAHFATMPPALAEVCVKAGSSEKGCCPTCGAPWERVQETVQGEPDPTQRTTAHYNTATRYGAGNGGNGGFDQLAARMREGTHHKATTGWVPTCDCPEHEPVPCTVLDPFSGSGTTGYVANRLGRHYVGTDLNLDYLPLAEARLMGMDPPESDDEKTQEGEASILDLIG